MVEVDIKPTIAGNTEALAINGNYIYVGGGKGLVKIYDITNIEDPVFVAELATPQKTDARDLLIDNNYLYLALNTSGIRVYQISGSYNLTYRGSYNTPGQSCVIRKSGNYLYVADISGGVIVLNVTNPANILLAATIAVDTYVYDIDVVGNYLYTLDFDAGLKIYDITTPTAPVAKGTYTHSGTLHYYTLDVSGNYAFIHIYHPTDYTIVVDISDPDSPAYATKFGLYFTSHGFKTGNYYYTSGTYSTEIFDVLDPFNVTSAGSFKTRGAVMKILHQGDYSITALDNRGISIYYGMPKP
jgi:hypothetical protein